MKRLTILGGGSWGTALGAILSPRFEQVRLWVRSAELAAEMESERLNNQYLPGISLPPNVSVTSVLAHAVGDADLLLSVLPSHGVRAIFTQAACRPDLPVVTATKGLEAHSLLRISQVIAQVSHCQQIAVLSGPSFAAEAARGYPTAVVAASQDQEFARTVQTLFSGGSIRVYTSSDPVGVELGGAYKNVVALGAGVCHGLGLGHNAVAALITRGLAEMTRLGVELGAKRATFAGLAGLGDLVLTCTGGLSRNRMVGEQIALGRSVAAITAEMRMVAEGVGTTRSVVELGRMHGVELPLAEQMEAMLNSERTPMEAIQLLMERALRHES